MNKKYIIYLAIAAVAFIAIGLGIKSANKKSVSGTVGQTPPVTNNTITNPTASGDNPDPNQYTSLWDKCKNPLPVLPSKSGIVQWNQPQLLNGLSIYASTPQGTDYIGDHSYLVGKITSGKYQGGDLLLTDTSYSGFSGSDAYDHIIRLNGKYYFLTKYSRNEFPAKNSAEHLVASVNLTADRNFTLSDLDFPQALHSNNPAADFSKHSTDIIFTDFDNIPFCADVLTKVFTDSQAGDVYSNGSGGFFVKAPDSTARVYEMNVSIMGKDGVPLVTWSDGKNNSQKYSYQMPSTCGPQTFMDVVNVKTSDLIQIGTTVNGQVIYGYKDPNAKDLNDTYDRMYVAQGKTKPSYNDFLSNHPVFVWQNPFGDFVRFVNQNYEELVGCG